MASMREHSRRVAKVGPVFGHRVSACGHHCGHFGIDKRSHDYRLMARILVPDVAGDFAMASRTFEVM